MLVISVINTKISTQKVYVPKKNPLITTIPTVNKFSIVNTLLSVEVLRIPEATITVNSFIWYVIWLEKYKSIVNL